MEVAPAAVPPPPASTDPLGQPVPAVFEDEEESLVRDSFLVFLEGYKEELTAEMEQQAVPPARVYIDELRRLKNDDRSTLRVDFRHMMEFESALAELIETQYIRFEPCLRRTIQRGMTKLFPDDPLVKDREYYLSITGMNVTCGLRDLRTSKIGSLCAFSATVTRTSDVRPELLAGTFRCVKCGAKSLSIEQQFKYTEPPKCRNDACDNHSRWDLLVEESRFVDWQRLRVQENSADIPAGSMPRSLDVVLRHEVVERAKAGDRAVFTGTLIVVPDVAQLNTPGAKAVAIAAPLERGWGPQQGVTGLKALGASRELNYKLCFLACDVRLADSNSTSRRLDDFKEETEAEVLAGMTPAEREELVRIAETSDLYQKLVHSIAPSIFGHDEVKRGVLLMLFGGVHKTTPDGIRLRGDINVCIVGDPSTAKSQFLKHIVGFYPRAIYTSGKASSAAGLTATVVKDPDSGEFNIEAGALMLADNGICCIDEFDKMDVKDQVAIHEAMEQQTISIAKAGINATLNARTSILAAANPIGGRYDRSKTLRANLNLGPAVMSRFDLFFVVLDECDEATDARVARHIISVHRQLDAALRPVFELPQLQRYIKFARTLQPEITPEAARMLAEGYRELRQRDLGGGKSAYRMTVRQLESLIRISESLARLHLNRQVQPKYVMEALRLLKKSIIHVETEDVVLDGAGGAAVTTAAAVPTDAIAAAMAVDVSPGIPPPVSPSATATAAAAAAADTAAARPFRSKRRGGSVAKPAVPTTASVSSSSSSVSVSKTPAAPAPAKKPAPLKVPYEEYRRITNTLVLILHKIETLSRHETFRQIDLVNAYLETCDGLESEQALIMERHKVQAVIARLLLKDHVLLIAQDSDTSADERVLVVHPNYDVEADLSSFKKRS